MMDPKRGDRLTIWVEIEISQSERFNTKSRPSLELLDPNLN